MIKISKNNAINLTKKGIIYINTYHSHTLSDCHNSPRCGHCAGAHKKLDCNKIDDAQVCANCVDAGLQADIANHSPYFYGCLVRRNELK